jgi:hypothetical protein
MVPILPCRSIHELARAQDLLGATDEFPRVRTSDVEEDR